MWLCATLQNSKIPFHIRKRIWEFQNSKAAILRTVFLFYTFKKIIWLLSKLQEKRESAYRLPAHTSYKTVFNTFQSEQ